MTKTSTLIPPSSSVLQPSVASEPKTEEAQLPEIADPSASSIANILNYSKSLQVMKSDLVRAIEVVNT